MRDPCSLKDVQRCEKKHETNAKEREGTRRNAKKREERDENAKKREVRESCAKVSEAWEGARL